MFVLFAENRMKNTKPKRVSFHSFLEKNYWIISNYQKHLISVHKLAPIKCKKYCDVELIGLNDGHTQTIVEPKDESVIFVTEETAHKEDANEVLIQFGVVEHVVYTQLTNQLRTMVSAILVNLKGEEYMQFEVSKITMSI